MSSSPGKSNGWETKTELDCVITSKEHFIALFSIKGRFLLPPKNFITWEFIRCVLSGEKQLLKLDDVKSLYVPPRLQEIPVTKLFDQVRTNKEMMRYFPDTNRPMDKAYFFAIVSAVLPHFFETVLSAIKERRDLAEPQAEKVLISAEMRQLSTENVAFVCPHKPVGQYLKSGRKWAHPGPRNIPEFRLNKMF